MTRADELNVSFETKVSPNQYYKNYMRSSRLRKKGGKRMPRKSRSKTKKADDEVMHFALPSLDS